MPTSLGSVRAVWILNIILGKIHYCLTGPQQRVRLLTMKGSVMRSHIRTLALAALGFVSIAAALFYFLPTQAPRSQAQQIWNNARRAGGYAFRADIVQTNLPLPKLANLGRSSKTFSYHIQGKTDLAARQLEFTLWDRGGNVTDAQTGAQFKIDNGRAYARRAEAPWQELDDFSGGFAPEGDFLAFLAGAKNIANAGHETRNGVTFTRFTYEIDGAGFAAFVRDQLEARLKQKGELPYGMNLDLTAQYADMTGRGELWMRADGLPLRQIVNVQFPPQNDYRTQAEITVDFFDFPTAPTQDLFALAALTWPTTRADLQTRVSNFQLATFNFQTLGAQLQALVLSVLPTIAAIFILAILLTLFARNYRSRYAYNALVIFIIVSMELSPLMQTAQANAFYDAQHAQAQAQAARHQAQTQAQVVQENIQAANVADPHRNPIVAAQEKEKIEPGALNPSASPASNIPSLVPACADSSDLDNDGLKKCEEDLLGTNPTLADSDGDTLSDGQEVAGFAYDSQTWYSDPQKASTLDDGILDGQKCSAAQFPNCPDTDGDGTPDLFDRDMDGDGVSNALDLSPLRQRADTFGENNPVAFVINNLTPNKLTYVEFQVRPTNEKHLWYAFNVLDWVQGDKAGQIQRDDAAPNTTFYEVCVANGGTNCKMSPDDNGDIKLVPMLEIRMSAWNNNLAPSTDLQPYGIFTKYSNGTTYAYVPLQLVTAKTANARRFMARWCTVRRTMRHGAARSKRVWCGRCKC